MNKVDFILAKSKGKSTLPVMVLGVVGEKKSNLLKSETIPFMSYFTEKKLSKLQQPKG